MSLTSLFPTKPWSISTIYGGSGEVRKDYMASDNEITEEIKQPNSCSFSS
jgi:hypothetical protein